ncbi:sulfurtransferase TusA family protein [Reinekea thalattae]|uniref:Sulfurtransferase TusA family protein n=1 Tax=Reinekea thalattae TaxID=2593301 RepID=A0A5C8Z9G0_9GAMM|nr:sulfurtransferase TusA family protein [Reinekea thalattae]TXR54014.1 sulfurtransferase TusA family protein [Reinekea thalattae]
MSVHQNHTEQESRLRIDTKTMRCPMPLLKLKMALSQCQVGTCIELEATDAGSKKDIPAYIELTKHRLVEQRDADGVYTFCIIKGE